MRCNLVLRTMYEASLATYGMQQTNINLQLAHVLS